MRLYSRNGKDWTARMPNLAAAFASLPCRSALLDGELVFPDEDGVPNFHGLRSADERNLVFFAFDLLHRDGNDLRALPLMERRRRLARLVGRAEIPCLHLVEAFADGGALLRAAERHGLEGIVSKREASAYYSGPSRDWVKIKTAAWRAANKERWKVFQRG